MGYTHQVRTDKYGRSRRRLANDMRRLKKQGDIPPIYPNGWFAILESDDLKAEHVRAVNVLGTLQYIFK